MVRDVCTKYIYDKCPAVAAVGELFLFLRHLTVPILNTQYLLWETVLSFTGLSAILSPLQVQLSSFLTTTECAVLCTGFGSKCSFNFIWFPVISPSFIFCSPVCKQTFLPTPFMPFFSVFYYENPSLLSLCVPGTPPQYCSRGTDTKGAFRHIRLCVGTNQSKTDLGFVMSL